MRQNIQDSCPTLYSLLFIKRWRCVSWPGSTTLIKIKKYNICCLQFHETDRDKVDFGSSKGTCHWQCSDESCELLMRHHIVRLPPRFSGRILSQTCLLVHHVYFILSHIRFLLNIYISNLIKFLQIFSFIKNYLDSRSFRPLLSFIV